MANYRVLVEKAHHVSLPSAELDVKDGLVDLAGLDQDIRSEVEAQLLRHPLIELVDEQAEAKRLADEQAEAKRLARQAERQGHGSRGDD